MNDEAKLQTTVPAPADTAKLIAAIVLVVAGIAGYYLLASRPEAWASWVSLAGGFALGFLLIAFSQYGRNFGQFVLESRVELRKVFWPTRQETTTTTLVVLVFVAVASTFFWLLDLVLAYVTRTLTGQGS